MEKYYPTWKISETDKVVKNSMEAYHSLYRKDAEIGKWTFSTNGVTINGVHGIPVIGFGPGNEVLAHAPNEKTPVGDLVVASAFYTAFAYLI
jgi:acetylornithine deacetylase/succinyl-diaminopimelate desuccinylase-like protein